MSKKIVIVGWPGVGKTELAKHVKGWIDLTLPGVSMPEYIERIQHALAKGQNVLLPTWIKLRDALAEADIDYTLVLPSRDLKFDYLNRIAKRGDKGKALFVVEQNWDNWMDSCLAEPCFNKLIMQRSGDYLEDYIPEIQKAYT